MRCETSDASAAEMTHADAVVAAALAAVRPAAAAWRAAVVATCEEVRGLLGGAAPAASDAGLGVFGSGRIDAERFSGLVRRTRTLDDAALVRLRVDFDALRALAGRSDEALFVVRVRGGERLRDAVADALSEIGGAFGAAREAALVRQGAFRDAEHGALHQGLPFARWTRRERLLAPPLVVAVAGESLHAADLAEFLDGAVRIVLVVGGACPPAALVRLVTPGTFVMQTGDPAAVARIAASKGPAVAAMVSEGAALFVHDPAARGAFWDRVRIERTPAQPPRHAVGVWSAEQQAEELRALAALATRPSSLAVAHAAAARPAGEKAAAAEDPAGRLAAWLLGAAQADAPAGAPAAAGGA